MTAPTSLRDGPPAGGSYQSAFKVSRSQASDRRFPARCGRWTTAPCGCLARPHRAALAAWLAALMSPCGADLQAGPSLRSYFAPQVHARHAARRSCPDACDACCTGRANTTACRPRRAGWRDAAAVSAGTGSGAAPCDAVRVHRSATLAHAAARTRAARPTAWHWQVPPADARSSESGLPRGSTGRERMLRTIPLFDLRTQIRISRLGGDPASAECRTMRGRRVPSDERSHE